MARMAAPKAQKWSPAWFICLVVFAGVSSLITTNLIDTRQEFVRNQLEDRSSIPNAAARQSTRAPLRRRFDGRVIKVTSNRLVFRSQDYNFSLDNWPSSIAVHPGDRMLVYAEYRRPEHPGNPHDFDESNFAKSMGWVGSLTRVSDVVVEHTHGPSPHFVFHSIRERIQDRIDARFPEENANSIVSALLLADRSRLEEGITSQFKQTGLGHLLAISGLHMGMIAAFAHLGVWIFIRRIPLPSQLKQRFAASISLLIVLTFAFVVGLSPSVFRSLAMTFLVTLSALAHRKTPSYRYLGAAFIVLLMLRPSDIGSLGFWLSFSAVGAILTFMSSMRATHRRKGVIHSIISALLVSVAAIIGTSPFLLWAFGSFPLISVIVSPLGVFLLALALPLILVSVLLPASIVSFSLVGKEVIQLIISLAEWGSTTSLGETLTSPIHTIPGWIIPVWCIATIILFYRRPFVRRTSVSIWLVSALLTLFVPSTGVRMTFFDVGQGDAMLFSLAGKGSLIVDLGPSNKAGKTVLNHMNAQNIHENIHLVFSHGHVDHMGGSMAFLSSLSRQESHHLSILHSGWITNDGSKKKPLKRGDKIAIDEAVRVYVLHPNQSGFDNDASIVLLLKYGPTSILLAGDAEAAAEKRLIRDFAPLLSSNILKVGHHGSKTSSTAEFLDAVQPTFSIISAGINNRFNHPHQEVVDRLVAHQSDILSTSKNGAIQFYLGEQGIKEVKTTIK